MGTQRIIAAVGAPLAMVALSACGGTSDAAESGAVAADEVATLVDDVEVSDDTAEQATALSADEAALELSQCLRDQGLDVADIAVDADGNIDLRAALDSVNPGDEGFREAMDECRDILDNAGFGGGRRGGQFDDPAVEDAFFAFSECIREQGFEDVADLATPTGRGERGQGAGQGDGATDATADGDAEADGGTTDGPPEGGRGQRDGEFGDRASRLAERMELDPEDPEVIAAVEVCQPILDEALGGGAGGVAPDTEA